jgi:hypothetical protein
MADGEKNFEVRITTPADTSGAETTKRELREIESQADKAAAATGRVSVGPGAGTGSPPVPAGLIGDNGAAVGAEERAAAEAKVALQMERQVIVETQLEAAELRIAGDVAGAARLEREAEIRLRSLTIQRALNVSTEEAIALAERLVMADEADAVAKAQGGLAAGVNLGKARSEAIILSRELATGTVNARTLSSLLGSLGTTLTVAGVAAYGIYKTVVDMAEAQVKVNEEIDKETEKLVAQGIQWGKLAKSATSVGDLQGLGDKIETELKAVSANMVDYRNKEITGWQKFTDYISSQVSAIPGHGASPYADALKSGQEQSEQLVQLAVKTANANIDAAQKSKAAWEKDQLGSLPEAIKKYADQIEDLKQKQQSVDRSTDGGVKKWSEYNGQIVEATKRHDELSTRQQKAASESAKLGEEINKVAFSQLDKPGQLESLNKDIGDVQKKLREMGVDAADPAAAFKDGTNQSSLAIQRLAAEWAKLLANRGSVEKLINQSESDAAKAASDWNKLHDETLSSVDQQIAIDHARTSGQEALAKKLEEQRDLQKEITQLMAQGLTYEEASTKATALQQANKPPLTPQQKDEADQEAHGAYKKHPDAYTRSPDAHGGPNDPIERSGHPHESQLRKFKKSEEDFQKQFQPKHAAESSKTAPASPDPIFASILTALHDVVRNTDRMVSTWQ